MRIDSIQNGIVLDHITPGMGMKLYEYLHLDALGCQVAMIIGAKSERMGKKDIIKIDSPIDLDLDVIGYVDPGITVDVIRNGVLTEKFNVKLPEKIVGVIKCNNPRCITTTEQELPQIFRLADPEKRLYRCVYCETKAKKQL